MQAASLPAMCRGCCSKAVLEVPEAAASSMFIGPGPVVRALACCISTIHAVGNHRKNQSHTCRGVSRIGMCSSCLHNRSSLLIKDSPAPRHGIPHRLWIRSRFSSRASLIQSHAPILLHLCLWAVRGRASLLPYPSGPILPPHSTRLLSPDGQLLVLSLFEVYSMPAE